MMRLLAKSAVFTGLIAALYIAHLVESLSPAIDRWLAR